MWQIAIIKLSFCLFPKMDVVWRQRIRNWYCYQATYKYRKIYVHTNIERNFCKQNSWPMWIYRCYTLQFQVETRLKNPTKYHVLQSQKQQVRKYLETEEDSGQKTKNNHFLLVPPKATFMPRSAPETTTSGDEGWSQIKLEFSLVCFLWIRRNVQCAHAWLKSISTLG